ncbi:MAG: tetratricopeptide repeat protein, partial [Limisphaerales bacterium]
MISSSSRPAVLVPDGRGASRWLFPLFLALVTFIAYIPAWHGGFLLKDDEFILHNPNINFFQGLYRIWFKTSVQYYPLTYTTFWIEYHFWGLHTLGYHLVNIGFHAADAILLWFVLLRLKVPGAWLASAIFALHPVNVESVAWIVERKNTLSGFFFLFSILAALKFWLPTEPRRSRGDETLTKPEPKNPRITELVRDSERRLLRTSTGRSRGHETLTVSENLPQSFGHLKYYWLAFALFLCALFSKTTTIPLPAVILLLVWWKRGRIAWRDIYPCIPFVVAGIAVGAITHHFEHDLGAYGKDFQFSFTDRVLLAARNFWFYLGKLVWPHPLMFVYPRWNIHSPSPLAWLALLAFVPALALLWTARKAWGRPVFVAFAYFAGLLFLMLGFFNIFFFLYSFVSDHFVYLACIGPIALFAAALTLAFRKGRGDETVTTEIGRSRGDETLTTETGTGSESPHVASYGYLAVSACILGILAALTWNQAHVYSSDVALWRDTIAKNPTAFLAYNNLGDILLHAGQLTSAIEQYEKSVAIRPDPGIYHNLGNALLSKGQPAEALAAFQKELR